MASRKEKYPDTDIFKFHNQNPKNRITGDCRIRAISLCTEIPYNDVVMGLALMQCETGYDQCNDGIDIYMNRIGWEKCKQPRKDDNTKLTLKEFIEKFPRGSYVVNMPSHMTAVVDGVCYDIWDCTKTESRVGIYWRKSK